MTVRLFVSYSHKDEPFRAKLKIHLASLEREGLSVFYDGDITPGKALDPEIKRELKNAMIFIALASPDYLASRYCFVTEYQYALRRAARGTMYVVVAVLRPCQWKHTRMGHYKSLPLDGKEVTRWANRDAAFEGVVNGLRRVVAEAKAEGQQQTERSPKRRIVRKPPASVQGRTHGKPRTAKRSPGQTSDRLRPAATAARTKAPSAPKEASARIASKSPATKVQRPKR